MTRVLKRTIERYPEEEKIVFINSWNEWAEGTYLEPDQRYGHGYLRATRSAILAAQNLEEILSLCKNANFHDEIIKGILHYLHKKDESEIILMKIIEEKEAKIVNLEAQLNERFLFRCYYKIRDKLFPPGSKRRVIAKNFRDRFLNRDRG